MDSHFRKFRFSVALLVIAACAVACGGEPKSDTKQPLSSQASRSVGDNHGPAAGGTWQIPGAKVQHEDVIDSPLKTQITLRVSIPRGVSRDQLDVYLRGIYQQQIARIGFSARKHPNSVYVYVYSEGTPYSGLSYIGSVGQAASGKPPTFANSLCASGIEGVREALGTSTSPLPVGVEVKKPEDGLQVTLPLTGRFSNNKYAEEIVPSEAWMALFGAAESIYCRVPDADSVQFLVHIGAEFSYMRT